MAISGETYEQLGKPQKGFVWTRQTHLAGDRPLQGITQLQREKFAATSICSGQTLN